MQGGGKHLTAHLDPCGDRTELGGQVQARFACAEKKRKSSGIYRVRGRSAFADGCVGDWQPMT